MQSKRTELKRKLYANLQTTCCMSNICSSAKLIRISKAQDGDTHTTHDGWRFLLVKLRREGDLMRTHSFSHS